MGSINTSINLHDGMTGVLHSMYIGVSHLVGGFRDMRNTVNGGFNESAFNNFRQHMSDAIAQMGIMEREAQRASQTAKQAFDWKRTINFDVFGGGAEERFKSEVNGIASQMERVISQQRYIDNKALNMRLLPRSAVSDIGETSVRLRNLISSMEQLKNIDADKLSNGQRNRFSAEYESMRQNIVAMRQLQKDMDESIKSGDVSGVNSGFNQIKSIVEQTEMRLRNFRETLSQVNNFSWQGGGVEIFNTHGLTRAKQEINSAKSMAEGLIQTQRKLTAKAEKMRMLPPNAVTEIQNINKRISGIGGTIARLEREKNKLSRWNVSGINQYNSRIESLRQKIYEAEQAQRDFNSAVRNNDAEALNSAYKRLAGTIDRIDIDIRDNNSAQQQFNSGINAGNKNALNLGNSIRNIGNQLKMYAGMALGGFGLKSALDITDTYTNLNARLGLITKSMAETKVFQDKLYESAQRTGSSYTDMAGTTAKLGLLAGGAFKNNAELTKFSELMAKSFKVSGASAQEQAAGMYQLTQAMASGRLQGDEFRSIIENAPMLAQAIQTYTGVSMEGLREMSKEGQISAEIILNSVFLAGAEIEKKFAEMPKTFGSYFSEIKNTALIEFSGIMAGINSAINTEGFKSFIENVKITIGNMAEWITLRFYEFRVLFSGLWTSASPAFNAICGGLAAIRNYIFSANGVLGQLIKTMSRLVSSAGFINSIKTIAGVFIMTIDAIMLFIQAMSGLISTFDWLGPVLIKVIAAIKVYNIVCAKTQGIMRVLNGIINIFTSATRTATTAVNTETTATNGATIAQRGLNAAIRANPMGLLASALMLVISLFRDLNDEIDEVNSKTG
ncbi:MAG: tape measure protein [Clostridiales bacterium]|nr:tape measure protein [Clostridiales bacterium]